MKSFNKIIISLTLILRINPSNNSKLVNKIVDKNIAGIVGIDNTDSNKVINRDIKNLLTTTNLLKSKKSNLAKTKKSNLPKFKKSNLTKKSNFAKKQIF